VAKKQVKSIIRPALKWSRRGLLTLFVSYLILLAGFSEFDPSPVDLAVSRYQYSILNWELTHLPDKWTHKIAGILPGSPNRTQAEKFAQVEEFFDLGVELRNLERQILFPQTESAGQTSTPDNTTPLKIDIYNIKEKRQRLQADVEEIIETEISKVLNQEGISSPIGIFPPVDAVFTSSPHVLILSPRDKIERQQDILLNPGLSGLEKSSIEGEIFFKKDDLSVYIEDTGGVAVYPSVVTDKFGLQSTTEITSHEWIHHWLLFRPLGRGFWSGAAMASLNETVATLAGQELGDKVYASLTGEVLNRTRPSSTTIPDPNAFDFRTEMQEARLQAEEFLSAGKIEEAEAYMEERRQIFVDHGYLIRKLNQAYFAFHGTYAASAASISPIGGQVQQLRDQSDSLEHFLKTVSGFSTYLEFVEHLEGLPESQEESKK